MRANVSLVMSHGASEPILLHPDYEQNVLHQKAFDKVRRVSNVKINDSSGVTRYIHEYPVENNDWGDFQAHRRLLGVVTIGKFESQTELNEFCREHESLKIRYSSTLYDSRAIFFGPSPTKAADKVNSAGGDQQLLCSTSSPLKNDNVNVNCSNKFTTPSNFKAQAFFYSEEDSCADLESHIAEFVNALFWVLESKRLDRSREKAEKMSILCSNTINGSGKCFAHNTTNKQQG